MNLTEKHRPQSWAEVIGQPKAVGVLRSLAERGWGARALWISGKSGAGKTTLAMIYAAIRCAI